MIIQYFSDVHVENFAQNVGKLLKFNIQVVGDYLFLAGDIGNVDSKIYFHFLKYLSKKFENQKIILISGNHEYYTKQKYFEFDWIEKINNKIKLFCKDTNIIFLNNEIYIIPNSNYIVFGATLWSKIKHEEYEDVLKYMNDYRFIPNFTIENSEKLHNETIEKLDYYLKLFPKKKFLVITHHLPSFDVLSLKYKDFSINVDSAYATELEILKNEQILKWFCGHSHHSIIKDKILLNALGSDIFIENIFNKFIEI